MRERYTPSGVFRRTPEERADQEVSWNRSDQAFFAAGACHILAWEFVARHPAYRLAGMWKAGDESPSHVIATDGTWAFDHDGWTREVDVLAETAAFESGRWELRPIPTDLATFCADHWHRMPHQYHQDPRPRARAYLDRFPPSPEV
ncbi:hypothetical protein E0H75_07495 [Kribbella capetownensis]|uniref:Uncharacterized protein n=1 Tax=Kribbella capetownensis TaxID=1572659 RepID=A0A4R0K2K7_9ACTN|nr:hypothetical protein [Kribbella capetownensis]TCC53520.1 hypothetical protein E0H75_07495 [Kribbella capetownensis]